MLSVRTCIDVDDLDMGISFYTKGLGLKLGRCSQGWAELLGAACPIDLIVKKAGSRPTPAGEVVRSYRRHWTPVHLDFVVMEIEVAVARCQAAGARLEQAVADKPWGRIAILADPFGHGFCLLEFRGRGYDEVSEP